MGFKLCLAVFKQNFLNWMIKKCILILYSPCYSA
nr:MAG TPA: hypothetical protein [Caudoviricetes sp.]